MKIELENRIALVADGTNDIGKAICKQLAESGALVVCLVPDKKSARQSDDWFAEFGLDVKVFATNVADFASCEKILLKIESEIGHIDILVNNSDFSSTVQLREMSQQQWLESRNINLDSAYNLCRHVSEKMSERGFGRIINISSIYGRMGGSGKSAYAASKAGLHGFTKALAQEVARKGVTVNTVSPGHIRMDSNSELSASDSNKLIAEIPVARFGEASEVASLVDFLCSQQASYITGADIAINGGQYIH